MQKKNLVREVAVPQKPIVSNVVVTGSDSVQLTLTSEVAENLHAPVSYFVVTSNSGGIWKLVNSKSRVYEIKGLQSSTSYRFTVTATNADGVSEASVVTDPVVTHYFNPIRQENLSDNSSQTAPVPTPAFTISSSAETKTAGSAISGFTITSTGGTIVGYSISPPAPSGLMFNTSTGALTGTPSSFQSATAYTITATNASGTASAVFILTVEPVPLPAFTVSSSSESKSAGSAITGFTSTSTGGTIVSYSISPSAPSGLNFNTSTGALSGTPSATQSATAYTITGTNASGSATATFTLTVTVALPAFTISSSSESQFAGSAITGFTSSSTGGTISSYSISPSAPSGLNFNTSTGALSGTPSATQSATAYTISATNASGTANATFTLTITIALPAFTISSSSETKTAGSAITGFTSTSTGGTIAGYSISPSAPSGLMFNTSTGALTGTPSASQGATAYTITATNASGTASATFTLTVEALAAPAFTISSSSESKSAGTAITGFTSTSTGGTIASYSISPDAPSGLNFNTSTGALSGTPSATQSATSYTITATNASGTATATFTLTVTAVVYTVGQTGPGGGKIAYAAPSGTTFACGPTRSLACTYIEVSSFVSSGSWGPSTTTSATATAIGSGYENTLKMNNDSNNARYKVTQYRGPNNYSDWHLPSQEELAVIYTNRVAASAPGGIQWSSTETGESLAWVINFGDSARGGNFKSTGNNIMAIRTG